MLTIRPSRAQPGKWVICHADTRTALTHPGARLAKTFWEQERALALSFFDTSDDAIAGIADWETLAEEFESIQGPRPIMASPAKVRTLADEISALRAYMKARDANPFHGWRPCSGVHCQCVTRPETWKPVTRAELQQTQIRTAHAHAHPVVRRNRPVRAPVRVSRGTAQAAGAERVAF